VRLWRNRKAVSTVTGLSNEGDRMYIGGGLLAVILIIVLLILLF
jgi:hypothetical protein